MGMIGGASANLQTTILCDYKLYNEIDGTDQHISQIKETIATTANEISEFIDTASMSLSNIKNGISIIDELIRIFYNEEKETEGTEKKEKETEGTEKKEKETEGTEK